MKRLPSLLAVLCLASTVRAESPPVEARLSCRHEASPGRVLCELEVEARSGQLVWADAVVVSAPEMARPLRARVGPGQSTARTATRIRLPLSLAAAREGKGELQVRARWVRCPGGKASCITGQRVVRARVMVGAIQEAR
jgi:hypothetical protein